LRKIVPAVIAGATALAVGGGTFAYASLNKELTLTVDGAPRQVRTMAGTVGELLDDENIAVAAHDVVAPGKDTQLTEGSVVAVQFGRQLGAGGAGALASVSGLVSEAGRGRCGGTRRGAP
jgi:uncharacterized protein YabE (DUF348 family)